MTRGFWPASALFTARGTVLTPPWLRLPIPQAFFVPMLAMGSRVRVMPRFKVGLGRPLPRDKWGDDYSTVLSLDSNTLLSLYIFLHALHPSDARFAKLPGAHAASVP